MMRAVLAWLGVVVSITWVVGLPLQLAEVLRGPIVTWVIFVPMAAFEVPFALWLLIKASPPDSRSLLLPYDLNSQRLSVSDMKHRAGRSSLDRQSRPSRPGDCSFPYA